MLLIKAYKRSSRVKSHYNVGYVKKAAVLQQTAFKF